MKMQDHVKTVLKNDSQPDLGCGTLVVNLFAGLAEVAGTRQIQLDWKSGTAEVLRIQLGQICPSIVKLLSLSAIAIEHEVVDDTMLVCEGAEVNVFPPVSGG
ncbi:MAG: MoaD/ThiS family protein [Planctomycetota bacterium]|nr:MAG: MoaD/ThiS family protein [Planctomycetota bacterium]